MQNEISPDVAPHRRADYAIDAMFMNRWSPRAFSQEPVDDETLRCVFEAARWAPSSFNEQPWRFVVARSEADRKRFVDFLMPSNQVWAQAAPVLILIVAKKTFSHNGAPNAVHEFDAGCAWGFLALAALQNGLITHGMGGFNRGLARVALQVPDDYEPLAVIALGKHGDAAQLPENLRAREIPSGRRQLAEIVFESRFGAALS